VQCAPFPAASCEVMRQARTCLVRNWRKSLDLAVGIGLCQAAQTDKTSHGSED
jgi:hypothetical protein